MKKITVFATSLLIIGGLTFSSCSKKEKQQAAEDLQNTQDKVEQKADDVASDVKNGVNKAGDNIKESASQTKEDIAMERKKMAETLEEQRLKAKYE